METYFGFDEESVDSETSSLTSYNTDHTPATPEEDLEDVCPDLHLHEHGHIMFTAASLVSSNMQ